MQSSIFYSIISFGFENVSSHTKIRGFLSSRTT